MRVLWLGLLLLLALADQQAVNPPDNVKRIPPAGVAVPSADRAELEAGLAEFKREIETHRAELKGKPALFELLPDVQIYYEAVRIALAYDEFFDAKEIPIAKTLIRQGRERARLLSEGRAPWATQTGLVVRGYLSRIDGSVQPYGLVVPSSYRPESAARHRLDVWFHGRSETLNEINFINDRQKNPGQFTPPHTFVLHPYGRYCNANKFAGEVDMFEALAAVKKHYPIDDNRLVVRGFSMGGAACWHIATHYAGMWAAAAPGAGFAETPEYLKMIQPEATQPTAWYEQKLWHLYNSTDYAVNLFNLPIVAYSGEIDRQKQAADLMAQSLKDEGIELVHLIGPQTAHAYHPKTKEEIDRRIDSIAALGRSPMPRRVRFTTWTLRYNQMFWVVVDGLETHWERARVEAEIADARTIKVMTQNVSALTLSMPPGISPLEVDHPPQVLLDDQRLSAPAVLSDRSWTAHFRKDGKQWVAVNAVDDNSLRKRHGLQGPIDDAFTDSFIVVRPTGAALNERVGAWAAAEQSHFTTEWRRQFRGEARVKADTEITEADIAANNLILWGDPRSNSVIAKIIDRLPVRWDAQGVKVGDQLYTADRHAPILIYPNPLNPKRYIVINSGFTFREYDYTTNARQTPKLPDYAVVDLSVPATTRAPGRIVTAGFFNERWEWVPSKQ
jgi:dienelactone hydrolase